MKPGPKGLSIRQQQMVALVRSAADGISVADVAKHFGIGQPACRQALWTLKKGGYIGHLHARHLSVWCALHRLPALEAHINEVVTRRAAAALARAEEEPDDPLLHSRSVIVPAATAPRIVTRGVASVFDLAYAA